MGEFTPVYVINGMKTKEEAFLKIFKQLKDNEKSIISKGFSDELLFGTVDGQYSIILKGKGRVKGGKKD